MDKKRKFVHGKGKNWERYGMETLQTMYAAGVEYFTIAEFCSWSGLSRSATVVQFLQALVLRGWLSVEADELRSGRSGKTFSLKSAVWFGVVQPD